MKIFSAQQIRLWDQQTIQNEPVSSLQLMERASGGCFKYIISAFPGDQPFYIFCGTGNNGGDGLAIARMLFLAKRKIFVYILQADKRSEDFNANLLALSSLNISYSNLLSENDFPEMDENAIVIDALFGSGLNRPLEGFAAALVDHINRLNKTVVSIDIPSGLFADTSSLPDTVIQATKTLSFQTFKLSFLLPENEEHCGDIELLDIGLDKTFYNETVSPFSTIDKALINTIYRPRKNNAHKYNFGHALLFAGSQNMLGAGILAAKACLRSGTGLVSIKTDEEKQSAFQIAIPEAITSSETDFEKLSYKKTAIGFGPGLEISSYNKELLEFIIANSTVPLVIDASGLHLLSECLHSLKDKTIPVILTPHFGEFEKLFGKVSNDFERLELASQKAKELDCYIVLKGHHTAIICPDGEMYFNTTGNAGMATAGSGDVLTGMVTGLLAQGYNEKDACILAVYLHGLAGDLAAKKLSEESMIASDIIQYLGESFKTLSLKSI